MKHSELRAGNFLIGYEGKIIKVGKVFIDSLAVGFLVLVAIRGFVPIWAICPLLKLMRIGCVALGFIKKIGSPNLDIPIQKTPVLL